MIRDGLIKTISAVMATLTMLTGCSQATGETLSEGEAVVRTETPAPAVATPENAEQIVVPTAVVSEQSTVSAEKAEYLNYKFAYSISKENLCDSFVDTVKKECTETFSRDQGDANVAQLCEQSIYTGTKPSDFNNGAAFLVWSASTCGLVDAGTFLRSSSLTDIYAHMTEVNDFQTESLREATQFGGNKYTVENGDILFWFDDDGVAVNAGIVTQALGLKITTAICTTDGTVASFVLDTVDRDTNVIKSCTVVKMTYTCNEQLVFLFLVNDMGYSVAAACGAMANIYCESLFNPDVEEHNYMEGYGLCQWTGQRRNSFEMWCATNGLDHSKLRSQMLFMKYELENDVCGDLDWQLRKCGNTEQDAYTAGFLWCEMYENPKGTDKISETRGEFSRDSFFPAYKGHPYM